MKKFPNAFFCEKLSGIFSFLFLLSDLKSNLYLHQIEAF